MQLIFRGIGQVMFQNNMYSGIIFTIAIFCNSWILGTAALSGTLISTSAARIFKYRKEDIENGLYGFNGALTGIAVLFFFEINIVTAFALIIGAVCSTLLMRILKDRISPFTAPFVFITWLLIGLLLFVFNEELLPGPAVSAGRINVLSALANGFGQVMFQENRISGILFLFAIGINSRLAAWYALYASLAGFLFGLLLSVPVSALNSGLMGYNGILCAIALAGTKRSDLGWVTLAVFLSVIINIGLAEAGMITLTAPFVLSTWIVLIVKGLKNKRPLHSCARL